MSGGQRRLSVVYGRVITRKRWRVIQDYKRKRRNPIGHYWVPAYIAWVDDFERFMIHGCAERRSRQLAAPDDGRVVQQPAQGHAAGPVGQARRAAILLAPLPKVGR